MYIVYVPIYLCGTYISYVYSTVMVGIRLTVVLLCVYLVRITYLCQYIMYLPVYNNEAGVLYYEPEYNPFNWSSIMRIE